MQRHVTPVDTACVLRRDKMAAGSTDSQRSGRAGKLPYALGPGASRPPNVPNVTRFSKKSSVFPSAHLRVPAKLATVSLVRRCKLTCEACQTIIELLTALTVDHFNVFRKDYPKRTAPKMLAGRNDEDFASEYL